MNREDYMYLSLIVGILVIIGLCYALWYFYLRKKLLGQQPKKTEGYKGHHGCPSDGHHNKSIGLSDPTEGRMGSVGEIFNNNYWINADENCPNYGCHGNPATLPCAPRYMMIGDECCKCHKKHHPREKCHGDDKHHYDGHHFEDPNERYNERIEAGDHRGFDRNSFNGIPHKEKSHCGECDKCELCQVDFNNVPKENCDKKCDGISPTLRGMGEYEYMEDYKHHKNECFPPKVREPNIVIDYNKEEMVCRYSDVSLRKSIDYKRIRIENNSSCEVFVGINTCNKTMPKPCFLLGGGEVKDLGVNPPGCPDQYIWLMLPKKVCDCYEPCECEPKLEVVNTPHIMPGFGNEFVLQKGDNIWFIKDMNQFA